MIRKPVRWRRLGAATLASFAIAVTALAAQVSPPNAETPAPVSGKPAPVAKEITLDNAVLDRYVRKLPTRRHHDFYREARREIPAGAELTGQQFIEMYPESDTKFFYKAIDAQLEFKPDSGGGAESVTLFQNGHVVTMPGVDAGVAEQMQTDLAAKIASRRRRQRSRAAALE